jgi:hypothetical protein
VVIIIKKYIQNFIILLLYFLFHKHKIENLMYFIFFSILLGKHKKKQKRMNTEKEGDTLLN